MLGLLSIYSERKKLAEIKGKRAISIISKIIAMKKIVKTLIEIFSENLILNRKKIVYRYLAFSFYLKINNTPYP